MTRILTHSLGLGLAFTILSLSVYTGKVSANKWTWSRELGCLNVWQMAAIPSNITETVESPGARCSAGQVGSLCYGTEDCNVCAQYVCVW